MNILSGIYNLYQHAFQSVPTIYNFSSISHVHQQNLLKEAFPSISNIFVIYLPYVQSVVKRSGSVGIALGSLVRDSLETLHCVLEQDTLSSA